MKCDLKCRSFGPLAGYRIGMVGTRHFTDSLGHTLKQEGAVVSPILEMKVISHTKCPAMQEAYRNLAAYTWLIFTSANGVRLFFQEMQHSGMDYRLLGHINLPLSATAPAGNWQTSVSMQTICRIPSVPEHCPGTGIHPYRQRPHPHCPLQRRITCTDQYTGKSRTCLR